MSSPYIHMINPPQQASGCRWGWSRFSAAQESRCLLRLQAPDHHRVNTATYSSICYLWYFVSFTHRIEKEVKVIFVHSYKYILTFVLNIKSKILYLLLTALRKRSRSGSVDFATLLFSSKHICLWRGSWDYCWSITIDNDYGSKHICLWRWFRSASLKNWQNDNFVCFS